MFVKRFCLPSNVDIVSYENGTNNVSSCICSHYNHGKDFEKKIKVLSFGVNQMGDSKGISPGIHAEQDAIQKLKPIKNGKHFTSINILVIRLSGKNKLQSSKPCSTCVQCLGVLPQKKGYRIKYIYYSNEDGNIVKTSLQELENGQQHYSKYYKNKHLK